MTEKDEIHAFLSPQVTGILIAQAAISGIAAGAVGMAVAILSDGNWLGWGLAAGGGTFCISWLGGLTWWRSRIENIGKHDQVIPAEYPAEVVRVQVEQNAGHWVDYLDIPLDREKLVSVSKAIAGGAGFSLSALGGKGKSLTRSEFESLREYLVSHGLAFWTRPGSHTRGSELTAAGRALFRRLAADEDLTHPTTRGFD